MGLMDKELHAPFTILLEFVSMMGCSATQLRPGAESIVVSRHPAPRGCKFRGTVQGEQGGAFDGPFTSNKNLAQGAVKDMKNNARDVGANYVVIEDTHAGETISGGDDSISGHQTDVTHIGNAYACPPSGIGLN